MSFFARLVGRQTSQGFSFRGDPDSAIRSLTKFLSSVGQSPSFAECQDICEKTRNIWQCLHGLFSDKIGITDLGLSSWGQSSVIGQSSQPETRSIFHRAVPAFNEAIRTLQRAINSRHLEPWQIKHVNDMLKNIQERVVEFGIMVDDTKTYQERYNTLIARGSQSFTSKLTALREKEAAAAGISPE